MQASANGGHGRVEIGACPVHLVDERDARHAVPIGPAPDGLALRLHAGDRVEHGDRAAEDAQRALHLVGAPRLCTTPAA
jgi:hypothetical protein